MKTPNLKANSANGALRAKPASGRRVKPAGEANLGMKKRIRKKVKVTRRVKVAPKADPVNRVIL